MKPGFAIRTIVGTSTGAVGTAGAQAEGEKELLKAIRRHGKLTVAGVALETSLSVKQAGRMLSELASKGRLEVRAERGRPLYSLREGRG